MADPFCYSDRMILMKAFVARRSPKFREACKASEAPSRAPSGAPGAPSDFFMVFHQISLFFMVFHAFSSPAINPMTSLQTIYEKT
jgi:hypothetical protein